MERVIFAAVSALIECDKAYRGGDGYYGYGDYGYGDGTGHGDGDGDGYGCCLSSSNGFGCGFSLGTGDGVGYGDSYGNTGIKGGGIGREIAESHQ